MSCYHPFFVNNECAVCHQNITSCAQNSPTIKFSYIHPSATLTLSSIDRLRQGNFESLLARKKLNLVLDLDNTLIHASLMAYLNPKEKHLIQSMDDVSVLTHPKGSYAVKLRPGARDFIQSISNMFDCSVYTMACHDYAHYVVGALGGLQNFKWVISREDCTKERQKGFDIVLSYKHCSVIVDDNVGVWEESCRENVLQIKPYTFFPIKKGVEDDNDELGRVLKILRRIYSLYYKYEYGYGRKDVKYLLKQALMGQ